MKKYKILVFIAVALAILNTANYLRDNHSIFDFKKHTLESFAMSKLRDI